jgi:hypothetical protein
MFHLALFWAAIGLFSYTLFKYKIRSWWWFYLIPLWPVFLCYSSMIWKDVGFSFAFLSAISLLFHCHFSNKKPTLLQCGVIIVLLGYGIGVKYQAAYLLPVCVFWLSYLIFHKKVSKSCCLLTVGITLGILGLEKTIDHVLVPAKQQSHSWQMARLYDLAGVSVQANKPIFPDYILKNPYFSMVRLKKNYNFQNVDALMYDKYPTLVSTQNNMELASLWKIWKQTLVHHPFYYMRHRAGVWLKLINKNIADYYYYLNNGAASLKFSSITVPFLKKYLKFFPSLLLRFYWVFLIFFLAIKISTRIDTNIDLKFVYRLFPVIAFVQLGIYFFLSMASDLRYIFLSNLLAFFLIPLIYASKFSHKTEFPSVQPWR